MVKIIIDGKEIEAKEGSTILDAAKEAGLFIPTLCYLKNVSDIGACRVCVVEIEGNDKLCASCNTVVQEGMVIYTNSKRVRSARKINVELMLSKHDCHCPTCVRSGNCGLQSLANDLNVIEQHYTQKLSTNKWDKNLPLIRDTAKCIKCMRCVYVCENIQSLGVWEIGGTGTRTEVRVRGGASLLNVNCALCGQCITRCPVGALRERDDTDKVFDAISDPDKIVVVQVAPSVRAAWGDGLGLDPEKATVKRMAAAIKALGADYVFDTNFAADLTIMEEGSEFIERLTDKTGKAKLPMFTSCCPGWVRFIKLEYPELVNNLSTAKSPQQMFGAVSKSYFAKKIGVDPSKIFCVSVMPCLAKKYERAVPQVNSAGAGSDVDVVITTREIDRMLKASHVNVTALEEEDFDSPLGTGTGAAVIFGATGGVMEAALRSAYFLITGKNPDAEAFSFIRGPEWVREGTLDINGVIVKVAAVSGLANTRRLIELIKSGKVYYDFVEVMACPGGCAGGGGQPIKDGFELANERGARLYSLDKNADIRFSHENPDVMKMYAEYFVKPLSYKSHELLHTHQDAWSLK